MNHLVTNDAKEKSSIAFRHIIAGKQRVVLMTLIKVAFHFHYLAVVHAGWLLWLTGKLKWNVAIINVTSYTCVLAGMTHENTRHEKGGLLCEWCTSLHGSLFELRVNSVQLVHRLDQLYSKEVVIAKPLSFMMKPFDVDRYLCYTCNGEKEQTLKR